MCYCSGDPPEREVLQLTLSPCIHATAGLRISDRTVCAHLEMQFGFPLGLETAGRTLPQRRKEAEKRAAISLQVSFSREEIVQRKIINSSQLSLYCCF